MSKIDDLLLEDLEGDRERFEIQEMLSEFEYLGCNVDDYRDSVIIKFPDWANFINYNAIALGVDELTGDFTELIYFDAESRVRLAAELKFAKDGLKVDGILNGFLDALRDRCPWFRDGADTNDIKNSNKYGTVLDGKDCSYETLENAMITGETAKGNHYAAYTYGAKYDDRENQDRVGVSGRDVFVVADGVGGSGPGAGRVAHILTDVLLERMPFFANLSEEEVFLKMQEVMRESFKRMTAKRLNRMAATCFTACYISEEENGKKYYNVFSEGDCRAVLRRKTGEIFQITNDHTKDQREIDKKVRDGADEATLAKLRDKYLYSETRNRIYRSVRRCDDYSFREFEYFKIECRAGDRLVLMTDGCSDNLTSEELFEDTEGFDPGEALKIIAKKVKDQMFRARYYVNGSARLLFEYRKNNATFPEGMKCLPKIDDVGVVVVDVPDGDGVFAGDLQKARGDLLRVLRGGGMEV